MAEIKKAKVDFNELVPMTHKEILDKIRDYIVYQVGSIAYQVGSYEEVLKYLNQLEDRLMLLDCFCHPDSVNMTCLAKPFNSVPTPPRFDIVLYPKNAKEYAIVTEWFDEVTNK